MLLLLSAIQVVALTTLVVVVMAIHQVLDLSAPHLVVLVQIAAHNTLADMVAMDQVET